ncbi:serine/threonine-protein kinase Nek10 [Synchiropus picturatus]
MCQFSGWWAEVCRPEQRQSMTYIMASVSIATRRVAVRAVRPTLKDPSKTYNFCLLVTSLECARRTRPAQRSATEVTGTCDLRRLLALLNKSRPQVAAATLSSDPSTEASELEKFSVTFREQRCFSSHRQHQLFSDLLTSLVKKRLCSHWIRQAPPESLLRVLVCLRLLIRDQNLQKLFCRLEGVASLAQHLDSLTSTYTSCGEQALAGQQLVTITYMLQKVSGAEEQRLRVVESGAHMSLVKLLSATDGSLLRGALLALTALAESPECRRQIGALQVEEKLLVILQEYDLQSKRMSAELLRVLSPVPEVRGQLQASEGLPVLLSLLHLQDHRLLWSVTWILVQLCEDANNRREIRSWGGVQLLLRLLGRAARPIQEELLQEAVSPEQEVNDLSALQSACCAALAELSLDDTSALHIVQENGIHIIARLLLPHPSGVDLPSLQCYALRALRFLFSLERNRHHFKRLFPTDVLQLFIDVGHYVRDLAAYEGLQTRLSLCTEDELEVLRGSIETLDQNRPAMRVINGYSVLDHLGTGAFGSVFKVQKQSCQNLLALKEVNLHNPVFGKDKKSRDGSVEKIISELAIIKEQMTHPNIVKYYKTFVEGERLYIVMELIDGTSLAEHLGSLKEKQQRFSEDRIWTVFIQLCAALRYLHREKRIVHRDMTPNNIMLREGDRVTITDFGLAKQKQETCQLMSVVGTILYSCPEVVKNEPYGEKADVWALGCVLYQMATLQPPFHSSNMLLLASKIVEASYDPIQDGSFSHRVADMVTWCLTPDAERRPDIVAVSSRISDLVMKLMDAVVASHNSLEKRAHRDRKRAHKYFLESHGFRSQSLRESRSEIHSPFPLDRRLNSGEKIFLKIGWVRLMSSFVSDEDVELPTTSHTSDAAAGSGVKPTACVLPVQYSTREGRSPARTRPTPGVSLSCGSSASAGISVSQKKLRQVDDPVSRLLLQLHKLLFITQLPPAPQRDDRRRAVERFKKSLFQSGSDPGDLKVQMSKLVQGSSELLESGSHSPDWWSLVHHFHREPGDDRGTSLRQWERQAETL